MAQQKQLIPGNTQLYSANDCDNTFIKKSGETTVTNFKLNGVVNINGNLNLGTTSNIVSVAGRTNPINIITGGLTSEQGSGAQLTLCPSITVNEAGYFKIIAKDTSNTSVLIGKPNSELTWNNKNVVTSLNGQGADASGNVTIDTTVFATVEWVQGIFNKLLNVLEENV